MAKKILTVKEFLECGATDKKLVLTSYHNGNFRSEINGPVWNIHTEDHGGHYKTICWSDSDGDPEAVYESEDQKINSLMDANANEYTHTVWRKRK